ncbi:BamA/TamA family outer membrane protein [Sphingomonas psychrotolerans]|uniref:BamA/TamA family outer membrane protein n=1 Tax=Sphingomonas psychrotolerans TaxID=1327635 RepID=A0ABU3MZ31_9SPHN|nr:BamA/TamA family outer membrane protein [Sphingomonas psychrotolerans]MDT8757559.1 BamA/TamA family outer membrane protein [Sphingomonas psychrotolerans]
MRKGVKAVWIAALAGTAFLPGAVHAQVSDPKSGQGAPASLPNPEPAQTAPQDETIVPDAEFEAALPKLSDDINAPLESMQDFGKKPPVSQPAPPGAVTSQIENFPPPAAEAPEFAEPLVPLAQFKVEPVKIEGVDDEKVASIRYTTVVEGLDKIGLDDRFRDLSALEDGDGKAANATMVAARAREDEKLAVRLMQSLGYYDGTAVSTVEQNPKNSGNLRATITATPGNLYRLGQVKIVGDPTVPAGLLDKELNLNPGDPIQAERVQGAEANVSLRLLQQGYPFIKLGDRDILLDEESHLGDYTLPVDLGPRSVFGEIVTEGRRPVFGVDHINILRRYKPGQIYDSRKVDDLREALIATSLFSTVAVEPVRTGKPGPEGTEVVDLRVTQNRGRPRTLAGEVGYSTGQGFRAEGTWTHRNLFPPEGALIASAVLGTQEQGVSGTFRRSNAGQRDRTFQIQAAINHSDYAAFESYTGTLAVRWSRDSTPIWQKRWTYFYGAELVGSNEDQYNFSKGARDRGTWLIAALPTFLGYDTSDNLLNPTRGFRIKANASPETSVRGAARPYARLMLEGTAYYPVSSSIVIAGRARVGSIPGIARNDLPPSRRYYAGGGGSVRGFGYQELGPRSPDGRPVGGRSLNEFALEARYRFGNFGIVPFVDAGQVYEGLYPTGQNMRFGAGIGGRLYTNFGPLRVDVATPIARKPGESKIALYISIGQAF